MPVKSAAQFRLMEAAAHGKSSKVPESVGEDFLEKTPHSAKSNFAKGNNFAKALMKKKKK